MTSESALPWTHAALRTAVANRSAQFWCKRTLDVLSGALLVVLLLPLLLVIAALIKIDSPGPVLFVHQRVGARRRMQAGRPVWAVADFPMFKFRSIVDHADQALHRAQVLAFVQGRLNPSGSAKLENDPRVTRVGRLLRRTSLDELPQLFNVLRGEMSLVGPRPVPPYEVAAYVDWQRERLMKQVVYASAHGWHSSTRPPARRTLAHGRSGRSHRPGPRRRRAWPTG